jgi:hypothetical protein
MKEHERMSTHLRAVSDVDKFIDNVETYGNYMIALNNVREFRDRFIPVRRFSPEAVEYLSKRDIKPQLAFIDAFKRVDELEAVEKFFPDCIICGDDWNWRGPDGELGMQKVVMAFAKELRDHRRKGDLDSQEEVSARRILRGCFRCGRAFCAGSDRLVGTAVIFAG